MSGHVKEIAKSQVVRKCPELKAQSGFHLIASLNKKGGCWISTPRKRIFFHPDCFSHLTKSTLDLHDERKEEENAPHFFPQPQRPPEKAQLAELKPRQIHDNRTKIFTCMRL